MGCCASKPQAGVKAKGVKPQAGVKAVYTNDQQWGPENYGEQLVDDYQNYDDQLGPDNYQNYDQLGPDDGYSPDNYQNYDHYPPDNVVDGSLLSSQSSHAVTSNGSRSSPPRRKKGIKKKVRIDPTQGTLPLDFNGLLSPDEFSPSRSPAPVKKPARKSHKKFTPKKGQVWIWNQRDVRHWIQNLGDTYREYAAEFEDNAVDGPLLLRMDNNDYHELGVVSPLHVKKIQVELDRLVQQHKKGGPTVPDDVILTRSQMSDSVIRKKKKKKKRPKKTGVIPFPSQYSMFHQPALSPSLTSSVPRFNRPPMGAMMPQMYMQHAQPTMGMATPYGYQLFVPGPIYE